MGPTDAQLIARATDDPDAFGAVFDRHYDVVFRYAVARVGLAEAEELAAQTFLVAFERLDRYDRQRPDARPWLIGIAANLARQHHRGRVRAARAYARVRGRTSTTGGETATEAVELRHDLRPLAEAVARLPSRDRDVVLLIAVADLGHDEVAAALGIPVGTVRSRLHRARQALRTTTRAEIGGAA